MNSSEPESNREYLHRCPVQLSSPYVSSSYLSYPHRQRYLPINGNKHYVQVEGYLAHIIERSHLQNFVIKQNKKATGPHVTCIQKWNTTKHGKLLATLHMA